MKVDPGYMTRLLNTFFILLFNLLLFPAFSQDLTGVEYLLMMEQQRINRSVDPEKIYLPDIENQDVKYRPDEGGWFKLTSILVPEEELNIALTQESSIPSHIAQELSVLKDGKRYHRLFIHPESESFYADLIARHGYSKSLDFEATATSSSRSVLVRKIGKPEVTFFAKLSLNVELGGVVRTIPMGEVSRSVGTSDYILKHRNKLKGNFTIMPEVSGIIPKGFDRGGQIIRLIPSEVIQNKSFLIPLFALYAQREGTTLLEVMSKKAGMNPADFVKTKILAPFMESWTQWALTGPIVMEAHAQNVLMEFDQHKKPTGRFIHRDMGGFNIDTTAPKFKPSDKSTLVHFKSFEEEYHQKFSKKAKMQSLYTYFEGGFLYNIDLELQRIDSTYRRGSVYETSRTLLVQNLMSRTGKSEADLGITKSGGKIYNFIESERAFNSVLDRAMGVEDCSGFFRIFKFF